MEFINLPVSPEQLPAFEKLELKAVHPSYKIILKTEWVITSIILVGLTALSIYFIDELRKGYTWMIPVGAALAIIAIYFVSINRSFDFLSYAVREKDVIFQRGWIIRSVKACPFNRIQNCSVQSGPLERKHGLSSLVIYTAGTMGADMKIPGLLHEDAERLRHFILDKINAEPNESL